MTPARHLKPIRTGALPALRWRPTLFMSPLLLAIAACSHAPAAPERYTGSVLETTEDMVANCTLLDTVSGRSGLVGFFAPKGVDNIKQTLLRQADAMGATHVVWSKPEVGYEDTTLSGKAYRCDAKNRPHP